MEKSFRFCWCFRGSPSPRPLSKEGYFDNYLDKQCELYEFKSDIVTTNFVWYFHKSRTSVSKYSSLLYGLWGARQVNAKHC